MQCRATKTRSSSLAWSFWGHWRAAKSNLILQIGRGCLLFTSIIGRPWDFLNWSSVAVSVFRSKSGDQCRTMTYSTCKTANSSSTEANIAAYLVGLWSPLLTWLLRASVIPLSVFNMTQQTKLPTVWKQIENALTTAQTDQIFNTTHSTDYGTKITQVGYGTLQRPTHQLVQGQWNDPLILHWLFGI